MLQRSSLNSVTYDVIIIGAGISGLVCGSYLAKAGLKVLIVEQHDKPGGYCTSFKRHGFTFDAAAHSLGGYAHGKNFHRIITEFGIDRIVNITRLDPSDIVDTPDFQITFWNESARTVRELTDLFPHEKENIVRYYNYYNTIGAASQLENVKLKDKTFADVLASYFSDPRLMNALSYPIFGYTGLPPSLLHAFTGTKFFSETIIDGGYYLEGGMQMLPDAFAEVIRQLNGTLLYNRTVRKIVCSNSSVSGVELSTNEFLPAKYVVSACDITQTYTRMVESDFISEQTLEKLRSFTPAISSFILYVGIDAPYEKLPSPGTNIWNLPYYDLDQLYRTALWGDINNIGGGGFMFRVSPDRKTILAFCLAPFKEVQFWKQNKRRITGDFLDNICRLIPDLKKHIAYVDAATPSTLHRYTGNYQGSNYGWAPMQSQLFEPDFRQKSFIKGLYITGHWTAQTHGIPGVAYLGYQAAKLVLKQEQSRGHLV